MIPITSLNLNYISPTSIISTGLPELDQMFSAGGLYKGSSTLVTGSAGTAKTILAAYFALSSCHRDEPVLYFSFEESPHQLIRNMSTMGLNLQHYIDSGMLMIHASRPSLQGLELHLLTMYKMLESFKPRAVIIDPISSFMTIGNNSEVRNMLVRLMDTLKIMQINGLFTSLLHYGTEEQNDATIDAVSSLADTWLTVKNDERSTMRERNLLIVKARGMGHSNRMQRFVISDKGIRFINEREAYVTV